MVFERIDTRIEPIFMKITRIDMVYASIRVVMRC